MANPVLYESQSTTFGTADFLVSFVSGATGALPTTPAGFEVYPQFIKSIARTGAGVYLITLNQPVLSITQWNIGVLQASFASTSACDGYISIDASSVAAAPTLTITFFNRTGTVQPTDPAAGDKVRIYIGFRYKRA